MVPFWTGCIVMPVSLSLSLPLQSWQTLVALTCFTAVCWMVSSFRTENCGQGIEESVSDADDEGSELAQ